METRVGLGDALTHALTLAQAGRIPEALDVYGAILNELPDNLAALTNVGVLYCQQGNFANGADMLERALALDPGDDCVRQNLVAAYRAAWQSINVFEDKLRSVHILRRMLALIPEEAAVHRLNLEMLLAYSGERAVLSDYAPALAEDRLGKTLLIACMPKSGSSWLVSAMQKVSCFPTASLAHGFVENEQELYLPAILHWAQADKVVQQHCRASAPNIHLVQAFGMKPVVLVRNLADTLISMRDFWDNGAVRNSFLYPDWDSLDLDSKHEALVHHLAPWYVQFFVSWAMAERKCEVEPMWVRYEDMIPNKAETLSSIAAFAELPAGPAEIEAAIRAVDGDKAATRFNKGVAGRGAEAFTPAQHEMLRALTRPYPSIDFSPIGL